MDQSKAALLGFVIAMIVAVAPPSQSAAVRPTDFTISVTPTLVVGAGATSEFEITAKRGTKFTRSIVFRVQSSDPELTASLVSSSRSRAIARLEAAPSARSKAVTVTVTGVAGSIKRLATTTVSISPASSPVSSTVAQVITPTTLQPAADATPTRPFTLDATAEFPQVGPGGTAFVNVVLEAAAAGADVSPMASPDISSASLVSRSGPNLRYQVAVSQNAPTKLLVGFRARLGSASSEAFAPIRVDPKPFVQIGEIVVPHASVAIRKTFQLTEVSGIPRPEYTLDGRLPRVSAVIEHGECSPSGAVTICSETLIVALPLPFPAAGDYEPVLVATTPAGSFRYPFTVSIQGPARH